MRANLQIGRLLRILLPLLVITLLGIGPLPYHALEALHRAEGVHQSSLDAAQARKTASALALAAEHLTWKPSLWAQAGHYALAGGDAQLATTYFERANARDVLQGQELLELGDAYASLGENGQAIQTWEKALQKGADAWEAHSRLASAYQQAGAIDLAAGSIQALLDINPDQASLHHQLGLYLSLRDVPAAIQHLERAIARAPDASPATRLLVDRLEATLLLDNPAQQRLETGRALATAGEWELAGVAFSRATEIDPAYAAAWAYLGEAYQHTGRQDADELALQALEKARQLDPHSVVAVLYQAIYWQRHDYFDRAAELLQESTVQTPENPLLFAELGNTLAHLGELDTAYQAYQQAVDLAPRQPDYHRMLAVFTVRYEYHLREIGLPAARQAVKLASRDPAALDALAQVLYLLGDHLNAERLLARALSADPDYAPSHLHLGLIYALRGENWRARQEWATVRDLAPGTADAEQADRLQQYYFP